GETIRFTVKAQDSNGLSGGNMKIIREGQQQWLNYELTVKAGSTDTLEHSFTPASDTAPGIYTLYSLSVYDNAAYPNGSYFTSSADPDYFDGPALLAENFRFSFTVVNPGYTQKEDPRVINVKFSKTIVLPGDTVEVEVTVNDGGTPLENYMYLNINKILEGTYGNNITQIGGVNLNQATDGKYVGTYRVPAVFQQRNLSVGYMIYHKDGHSTQYSALDDKTYTAPVLTIGSVFNGVDDTSVLIGDTFDPMSGVTAANVSEGSLSSKINLEGEVDKQIAGVYLLKYTIPSNLPYKAHQEENPNGVYFASRIVGVTETEPSGYGTSEEEPLVIAEDSVIISADPEDITIEKDGAPVAFTDELTEEGIYEITDVSGELEPEAGLWYGYNNAGSVTFLSAHKSSSAVMFLSSAMSVSRKQSNIVLIDRSAPVISQITSKTSSEALSIQIKVKDLSPVAKIQYLAGTHDRDAVSKSGTVIRNDHKLSVSAGDTISVLATDTLGHIAFKVMTINQPSEIVNSEDPDISADPEGSVDISSYGSSLTYGGSSDEQSGTGQSGDSSNVSSSTEDPAAGNGSTLTVILIVVAVVVTGGAGAGIYFYKRKKK
ncbi:MAG: immunoglobulin-like domain-containing protein, partial [Saccharofermentanales bacterium]